MPLAPLSPSRLAHFPLGSDRRPARSGIVQRMSDALHLTIRFEPGEDDWIIASIPEVPGAISQGRTREEARANVIDALRLMLKPEPDAPPADSEPLELTIAA